MKAKLLPLGGISIRGDRNCGEFHLWYAGGLLMTRMQVTSTQMTGEDLRAVSRLALVADIVLRKLEAGEWASVCQTLEILNGEPLSDKDTERWMQWRQ